MNRSRLDFPPRSRGDRICPCLTSSPVPEFVIAPAGCFRAEFDRTVVGAVPALRCYRAPFPNLTASSCPLTPAPSFSPRRAHVLRPSSPLDRLAPPDPDFPIVLRPAIAGRALHLDPKTAESSVEPL
ncbi:glycine-rich protein 1-like [Iris pallida]|uniref:Glycine-rich protein 1-like n=1 Tax=Iris pallida TaxID=29817 RepID=A0AAX6H9X2_IRIPA|nr:glycine-rich protein 1-like [Iris pallida]KAJ6837514.1 glycine-rich protein 1-like [Iris pallida]